MGSVTAPLVALVAVGLLALLLRWACAPGRSLVARTPRRGAPTDYGLLVPVATPADMATGRAWCALLAGHGVRASLAYTQAGLRVLVWPDEADTARRLLGAGGRAPGD
jgi:hypothetical protein